MQDREIEAEQGVGFREIEADQGLGFREIKAEQDPRAALMESWADDPFDSGGVLKTVVPLLEPRVFPDASWLGRAGDPAAGVVFHQGGPGGDPAGALRSRAP